MYVYETTYIPWIDNKEGNPWLYIGSDSSERDDYFGSVSSKEWKHFWRNEIKDHPENFTKRILANCIINDRKELLNLEFQIQLQNDVVNSSTYFNKSFATKGCFGDKNNRRTGTRHTEETKRKMSEAWKTREEFSEETRKKMSVSAKLRLPTRGMLGIEHTETTKSKISSAMSGLKWWNNGLINKRSKQKPSQEWVSGRINYERI